FCFDATLNLQEQDMKKGLKNLRIGILPIVFHQQHVDVIPKHVKVLATEKQVWVEINIIQETDFKQPVLVLLIAQKKIFCKHDGATSQSLPCFKFVNLSGRNKEQTLRTELIGLKIDGLLARSLIHPKD